MTNVAFDVKLGRSSHGIDVILLIIRQTTVILHFLDKLIIYAQVSGIFIDIWFFFILIAWKLSFYFLLLSVDCEYGEYPDAITEPYCSKRCGGGTMVLVNQNITQPSQGGGQECVGANKTLPCNEQQCPTNCKRLLYTQYIL